MKPLATLESDWTPWPEHLAQRYRAKGYWLGEPLWRILSDGAQAYPDRVALMGGDQSWSYVQLDEGARRVAAGFISLGIQPGDHVVVQLPNIGEFFLTCFALWRLGARPVMALPGHRLSEMGYFCRHTRAVACVIVNRDGGFEFHDMATQLLQQSPDLKHICVVGEVGEGCGMVSFDALSRHDPVPVAQGWADASSLALLQLSGGSTGVPKLIPRTHDDYAYSVRASADICGWGPNTVYLAVLPVAHNFPLSSPGALGVLYAGGTVVLSRQAAPEHVFRLIEQERVTVTAVVPPLAQVWLDALPVNQRDLSSLRMMQVGGARLASDVAQRIVTQFGCRLQQVFGMAEGLVNYTRDDDPPVLVFNTQGLPISPDDEIRVVDDDDVDVPADVCGHLLVRGPYTIRGYFRADAHNARAFTPDGYYRTGDVVRRLLSGHLVVEGRAKDQINRGGEKIASEEVESHLLAHPSVHDVALVSVPDRHLGERTCAVVVARGDPPTRQALTGFLRQRGLAAYKFPDRYEFVAYLPKTSVGKINKRALREQLCKS